MVRSLPSGMRRWGQRIEEKTMSERDYLAKEEALRRRSEPEGDHKVHATLERMREAPHLWEVIHRVHLSGDADRPKLEEWRRAPDDIGLRWGTYTNTPAGFYFLEGGLPEPKDSLRELAKKPGGAR